MKKLMYLFIGASFFTYSCNNTEKKEEAKTETSMEMNHERMNHEEMDHSDMATKTNAEQVAESQAMTAILDSYLALKNALVEENDEKAATEGSTLATAFASVDVSGLEADKSKTANEIVESATEHAKHISENKGNIVHQREHLALLSKDVKDLVEMLGTDRTLYAEFCPMYDNNKGAMWLSASSDIKNPYFGSKMLTCGSVKEEIAVK
ncbi:DUF3347 domain-containing protein [Bernardetia sp.]|uniref:DUF3347 domain-containing protein n=1 Tax=Bernardetia sp. TaxID=1937974 RepID=UPI0025C55D5C|nr:DUF3347 domain-containing protein [Bernardetia sp.]